MSVAALPGVTSVEVIVKLGTTAQIAVDTVPSRHPILTLEADTITVLVMPYTASEGGPVTSDDVARAEELITAASRYRDALQAMMTGGRR